MAVPLLGSALAVGVAALPANATTWQDTALSASAVTADTFAGSGFGVANGTKVIDLSGKSVTWSLHAAPAGVSLSGTTISYSGAAVASPPDIVAVATDSAGNAEALRIPVTIAANSIQLKGPDSGVITVSLSKLADTNTSAGTVKFTATSSVGDSISFGQSNLPSGLSSGNPVLTFSGGTAAPGTYTKVVVTATDSDGAVLSGTFTLTVQASAVATAGTYGDEVNPFGNGFDVYQQHRYAGAVIAGWTATQDDPATHFELLNGTHSGAVKFEYGPNGSPTGLCVSDPGGGWASDPLPDGLILAVCNSGQFQQFVPQSNGTLKNLATGLVVSPNGKGAQLRGTAAPQAWGGSVYGWTEYGNLPK